MCYGNCPGGSEHYDSHTGDCVSKQDPVPCEIEEEEDDEKTEYNPEEDYDDQKHDYKEDRFKNY